MYIAGIFMYIAAITLSFGKIAEKMDEIVLNYNKTPLFHLRHCLELFVNPKILSTISCIVL